jgi:hypothetical protein
LFVMAAGKINDDPLARTYNGMGAMFLTMIVRWVDRRNCRILIGKLHGKHRSIRSMDIHANLAHPIGCRNIVRSFFGAVRRASLR